MNAIGVRVLGFVIGMTLLHGAATGQARPTGKTKDPYAQAPGVRVVAGPFNVGQAFANTPDHSAIAWVEYLPKGARVMLNGKPGPEFPAVEMDMMTTKMAVVSADGKSVAYVVKDELGKKRVALNGKLGEPCDGVVFETLTISPDGTRVAYAARRPGVGRFTMIIDGKETGPYFLVYAVAFSPDSKHVLYAAAAEQPIEKGRGGVDVFVDGQRYAADFRHVGDRFSKGAHAIFSPDSKHWAVRGQVYGPNTPEAGGVGGFAVMADGKMHATHVDVVKDTLTYTPGNKLLYAAGNVEKGDYRLYTDGAAGKSWNYIGPGSIAFGNGGKSIGMVGYTGGKSFRFGASNPVEGRQTWDPGMPGVAVNDALVAENATMFALSPVSDRVAWVAIKPGNDPNSPIRGPLMFALRDGKTSVDLPVDSQLQSMIFSPDGQHLAAAWRDSSGGGMALYFDGKVLAPPTGYLLHMGFAKGTTLRMVMMVGRSIWQIEVDPTKLPRQQIGGPFPGVGSTRPTTRGATTGPSTRLTIGSATRPTTRPATRPATRPTPRIITPRRGVPLRPAP